MKQAVMYGGGNIGRGFIGATLSQSGYEVTFIDVAEPVVKALQEKKQYPVRYVSSEGHEDVMIEHVTAVNGNDQEAASEAIANCDIMATAVGARILKFIVGNIVAGLRKRWARDDRPLNIIICENLMDANKVMEGMLKDLLTDEEKKHFDEKVGLVEASIGRMVPVQTEEMKDGDPMRVCATASCRSIRPRSRVKSRKLRTWFRSSRLISTSSVSCTSTTWATRPARIWAVTRAANTSTSPSMIPKF
mgnify:CR=1 FL=1